MFRGQAMSRKLFLVLTLVLVVCALAACGGPDSPTPTGAIPAASTTGARASTVGDATSLLASGQSKLSAGSLDAAVADFQASLSKGKSLDGYFGLGNAYTRQGKLVEAEQAYNEALKINPNHVATLSNLGVVYYQQTKLADAKRIFERALAARPDDAETHYLLGATELQLNELDAAEKSLNRALELKPQLPEARFGIAMLRQMQGRTQEAITEFEAFLSGPPAQDPQAKVEAEKMLKQLKGQ